MQNYDSPHFFIFLNEKKKESEKNKETTASLLEQKKGLSYTKDREIKSFWNNGWNAELLII